MKTRLTALAGAILLTVGMLVGSAAPIAANSGHGGPLAAIADIEDAQAAYAAKRYLTANRLAVVALRSLRHLYEEHATIPLLTSIGCGGEYRHWNEAAIKKMVALRIVAFGFGTKWEWAASPRLERVLATNVYRRAAADYEDDLDDLIDCVLDEVDLPPGFILELAF